MTDQKRRAVAPVVKSVQQEQDEIASLKKRLSDLMAVVQRQQQEISALKSNQTR